MSSRCSSIRGTFFLDGVPNIFRIFRTVGAKYSRIFCAGVQKIGDAKYSMTWGCQISHDMEMRLVVRGMKRLRTNYDKMPQKGCCHRAR